MERICTIERARGDVQTLNYTFSLGGVDVLTVSVKPADADGEPDQIGVWSLGGNLEPSPDRGDGLVASWEASS